MKTIETSAGARVASPPLSGFESTSRPLISIVVPCYNEEQVVPELVRRIDLAAKTWPCDYEVICVDDGSHDATWALLSEQTRTDARWRALSFARNFGHQTAVSAGIAHASGDAVMVIDADLQDPPEEFHRFIAKWGEGFDVVYAIRKKRKEGPLKRIFYWAFYRAMARMVSIQIPLDSGDFCIMSRRVAEVLRAMPERNRFVRGMRAWAGFKQIGLPYERHARAAGEAKYTFRKLLRLAADGIFSFSAVPLRAASILGVVVSTASFFGIIFTLVQRLFREFFASIGIGPVPGFATIVISVLFLGGVQLLCIGILGEYMARIYDEVKRRPSWVVREAAGIKPVAPPH